MSTTSLFSLLNNDIKLIVYRLIHNDFYRVVKVQYHNTFVTGDDIKWRHDTEWFEGKHTKVANWRTSSLLDEYNDNGLPIYDMYTGYVTERYRYQKYKIIGLPINY